MPLNIFNRKESSLCQGQETAREFDQKSPYLPCMQLSLVLGYWIIQNHILFLLFLFDCFLVVCLLFFVDFFLGGRG